jgi:hypothetical protein
MTSFDQLKAKYQSVLQVIQDEQISVKNLHLGDDKLFIRGLRRRSMPRIKFSMPRIKFGMKLTCRTGTNSAIRIS